MAPKKDFSSPSLLESHGAKQVFSAISSTPVSTAAPCVLKLAKRHVDRRIHRGFNHRPETRSNVKAETIEPTLAEKIPSICKWLEFWGEKSLEKFWGTCRAGYLIAKLQQKRIGGQTGRVRETPSEISLGYLGTLGASGIKKKRPLWKVACFPWLTWVVERICLFFVGHPNGH